jgi:hypothetical protein
MSRVKKEKKRRRRRGNKVDKKDDKTVDREVIGYQCSRSIFYGFVSLDLYN